jgi:hypothetical protein
MLLQAYGDGSAYCIEVGGQTALARIPQDSLDELRRRIAAEIRDSVASRPTAFEVSLMTESAAIHSGVHEFTEEIFNSFRDRVHFAGTSADAVLVSYGKSVDALVAAVVESSDEPLHFTEVRQRLSTLFGRDLIAGQVQNSLMSAGFFLFGRGTYGAWKHLRISDEEATDIAAAAESLLLNNDPDKQWHAREILESLPFDCSAALERIDHYGLTTILKRFAPRLRYLHRMIWVAIDSTHKATADRIDIYQACTALIRDAGRPMSAEELREMLKDWRGVGVHFQLHSTADLVLVGPNLWGLRSRDIVFGSENVGLVLDSLRTALEERGTGFHHTEIADALSARCVGIKNLDGYAVLAVALTDGRFIFGYGGYVGLSSWGNCRRLSISQCGRILASEKGTRLSLDAARSKIEQISGRAVSKTDATAAMRGAGMRFDKATHVWYVPDDSAAQADDDEALSEEESQTEEDDD